MPADDPSGARPPVVLRIKLRYDDVEAMVQRFAPNVGKSGLFIPTKSLQPIGTEVKFELRLANDQPVLVGLGRVKAVRAPDPANPRAVFGMAIELMRVTREAREVIIRLIERRRAMGLADVAIPMPEDVESARRADVETQPRADTAAIVSSAMAVLESAPILVARPTPPEVRAPVPESVKTAAPPSRPTPTSSPIARRADGPPEALLTAPRPSSGPAVVTRPSAAGLAPEPARATRPRLADLMAKAAELSGAAAATGVPGLDDHVDVDRAMIRARALAGANDLEAELAALREAAAAPLVEISIEAASAELARALGGAAVGKRSRVVGVPALGTAEMPTVAQPVEAPPSAVVATPVGDVPDASALANDAAAGSEILAPEAAITEAMVPERDLEAEPGERASSPVLRALGSDPEPRRVRAQTAPALIVDDEPDHELASTASARDGSRLAPVTSDELLVDPELDSFDRAFEAARVHTGVARTAAPLDEDGIDELDPDDIEELPGESTQIGQVAGHLDAGLGGSPIAQQLHLADALDRELAEAESDDNELAASIRAAAAAYEAELAEVPEAHAQLDDEEISDLDVLAEADASDADLLSSHGERESSDGAPAYAPAADYEPVAAEPADAAYVHQAYDSEAYAAPASADLAYAQQDAAYAPGAQPDPANTSEQEPDRPPESSSSGGRPARRATDDDFDFAAQLDLGDDDDVVAPGEPPLPDVDAYNATSDYTIAERLAYTPPSFAEPPGLDAALDFDDPHQFATQTPAKPEPRGRANSRSRAPLAQTARYAAADPSSDPVDFDEPHRFAEPARGSLDDLENALSTLDVDLDHLAVPDASRAARAPRASRSSTGVPSLPGMPPERDPDPRAPAYDRPNRTPKRRGQPSKRGTAAAPTPVAKRPAPAPRAASEGDGGVLIDFDNEDDDA